MVEADHQTGKLSGWEATVVDRVNMSFRLGGAVVERTTLCGSLRSLGGTGSFKAEIDFDHHGLIRCTLDETLAKQMAPMLGKRVSVSGVLRRDAQRTLLRKPYAGLALVMQVRQALDARAARAPT